MQLFRGKDGADAATVRALRAMVAVCTDATDAPVVGDWTAVVAEYNHGHMGREWSVYDRRSHLVNRKRRERAAVDCESGSRTVKNAKPVALILTLLALLGWGIWKASEHATEDRLAAASAITASLKADSVRDSIGKAVRLKASEDSANGVAVVAALVYEKNQATRATNRAIAHVNQLRDSLAHVQAPTPNDTIGPPDVWHERYAMLSVAFDSVVANITQERLARERERHTADSIYSASRAKILNDFDEYRSSVAYSDSVKRVALATAVTQARGDGKRSGVTQAAVVIGGTWGVVEVVKAIVKARKAAK